MYLNKKQLNERKWSPKMIVDLLGEPDDVRPLGRYCEEHLYFLPRVERIERTDEFKSAHEKYLTRRNAGKLAAKKQAEERIKKAETMMIRVRRLPAEKVLEDAIDHFNFRGGRRWEDDFCYADKDSDQKFLERIQVNYIRHELTSYDAKLFEQRGRIGGDAAVPIIRRRVFLEIACAYPHLADACWRQMLYKQLITQTEYDNFYKAEFEQMMLPF